MPASRRLLSVRVAALVGLSASAALAADAIRPGARAFCPLEEACEAARSSALGSILGVPTSVVGVLAFLGLLFLSLWRNCRRRAALRAAGMAAGVTGLGLLAYQAFALDGFCPLCLVADLSGVALGAIVFRWKGAPGVERRRARIAWAAAGVGLAALVLFWPRAARPSWTAVHGGGDAGEAAAIPLREYLNPFCSHCRATHARLASVLKDLAPPVRRQRLYVWTGKKPPYWAQACVCAQDQGDLVERAFFRELLKAKNDRREEVLAAALRAKVDVPALEACIASGAPLERLARVRKIVDAAEISGMPTIDLGLRRLEGEQTEEELRAAVEAAVADLASGALR